MAVNVHEVPVVEPGVGAAHETELRIVPARGTADPDRLVMARPTYNYRISATGLELRATFRLDAAQYSQGDLKLEVDSQLRVAAVQLDGEFKLSRTV